MKKHLDSLSFIGRLLITASIAILVAGAVMLFVSAHQEVADIRDDMSLELQDELESLPTALAETVVIGDYATLQQQLDHYAKRPMVSSVRFTDASGAVLFSYEPHELAKAPLWFFGFFGVSNIVGEAPLIVGGRYYGKLHLTLGGNRFANRAWFHLLSHMSILLLAVSLDFIGIWLILRSGLASLKRLEEASMLMATGNLKVSLKKTGSPEFRRVIEAFNYMAEAVRTNQTTMQELVTLQQQTAMVISQLSQRLSLAADAAQIGVWDYLISEDKLIWDSWMLNLYGVSEADFGGAYASWQNGLHPDDRLRCDDEIKQALRGENEFKSEFRVIWPTGEERYITAAAKVIRSADGEPQRMIGINYDITERHLAVARLKDRTEELNTIFSLSPDGLVSFDQSGRVTYVNSVFLKMTGLHEAIIAGASETIFDEAMCSICVTQARFPGMARLRETSATINAAPAGKTENENRYLIELAGPTRKTIEVGYRASKTKTVSQILYLRDVTHETEVDRMKSEFLSSAAHELRTPMASIFGFAELLLVQSVDEETKRDLLTTIYQQAELMAQIINELLDLARIESQQRKDFVFENLSLVDVVNMSISGYKLPKGRAAPVVECQTVSTDVIADSSKLQQVVTNLLSNAYKYSAVGSEVNIRYQTNKIGNAGMIGFEVRDHGIGMTTKQVSRVFERFFEQTLQAKCRAPGWV